MDMKYGIGLDYGTLSARAILVELEGGEEKADLVFKYPHAVIDTVLPETEEELPVNFALQDPQDYLDAAEYLLGNVWKKAGINPSDIVSVGIDFTACTPLALDKEKNPLCFNPLYRKNPHSWVKLWKHHGANRQCEKINKTAAQRNEQFFDYYGRNSSSEWLFAKLCECYEEAPEVFDAADCFMESGDWMVGQLTGHYCASNCTAGFKGFWNEQDAYPSKEYLNEVSDGFGAVLDKLTDEVLPVGSSAGHLSPKWAQKTGLSENLQVAVCVIDAHSAYPAVGICENNAMLMSVGTSLCHILVSDQKKLVKGISGVVSEGVLPGSYAYEAGQAAVGDIYNWFMTSCVPEEYFRRAEEKGVGIFSYVEELAAKLKPGQSGLVALDWWNGNRSTLYDDKLSGLILGLTLQTKPEEIYRAIIEATAFGTKRIIETFISEGVPVDTLYACGGISQKSPLAMQIFADVTGMDIKISDIEQTAALGSAIYGAVAAGAFKDFPEAVSAMAGKYSVTYRCNENANREYLKIYGIYSKLYDYFGKENKEIMYELSDSRAVD